MTHLHSRRTPYSVNVCAGAIEVLGTSFTVVQRDAEGEVTLHQGAIRFRAADGREVAVAPGQTLIWPLPSSPPAVSGADQVLATVALLRSRGRFGEAAGVLEDALLRPLPSATRERLSFELGSILTYQLRDRERACRHWARHRREAPGGRYERELDQALSGLGCE